jgi:hypothetical protein
MLNSAPKRCAFFCAFLHINLYSKNIFYIFAYKFEYQTIMQINDIKRLIRGLQLSILLAGKNKPTDANIMLLHRLIRTYALAKITLQKINNTSHQDKK